MPRDLAPPHHPCEDDGVDSSWLGIRCRAVPSKFVGEAKRSVLVRPSHKFMLMFITITNRSYLPVSAEDDDCALLEK